MGSTIETVLVAGASGRTGRELLDELRGTDLRVRALTRSAGTTGTLERLGADEMVVGDLLRRPDADRAIADRADGHAVDAVLCAVGTRPAPGALVGDPVDGAGVINLIRAASQAGVERFVLESSIGVGDSVGAMPRPVRLPLGPLLDAKDRAEARLRESGMAYTVLRPGRLTNDPPSGDVVVGEGGDSVSGSVPRTDVARLMAAAPFTPDAEDRTFELASREGLRGAPSNVVPLTWTEPTARPDGV